MNFECNTSETLDISKLEALKAFIKSQNIYFTGLKKGRVQPEMRTLKDHLKKKFKPSYIKISPANQTRIDNPITLRSHYNE